MIIPAHVLNFAAGDKNIEPYKMFYDYWQHYRYTQGKTDAQFQKSVDGREITFSEKEDKMNKALLREILRQAHIQNFDEFSVEQMAGHPLFKWATFAVISAMVDMVLPDAIIDSIGMYSEVRNIPWGDNAAFTIKPRDLFVVSKHGRGQRTTEVHKQFVAQRTIEPESHQLTVGTALFKVLTGAESLADLVTKVIRSMEVSLTQEVYDAFHAAMLTLDSTASTGLQASGYTQDELVRLCEQVSAWNMSGAAIVGTKRALASVLPNDANYRYMLNDEYMRIGYVSNAFGYPVIGLPQAANWGTPFSTYLSNDYIYILSPASDKFVKVVLEGSTLTNTDGNFDNANLTINSTLIKSWGVGIATSAVAGIIAL